MATREPASTDQKAAEAAWATMAALGNPTAIQRFWLMTTMTAPVVHTVPNGRVVAEGRLTYTNPYLLNTSGHLVGSVSDDEPITEHDEDRYTIRVTLTTRTGTHQPHPIHEIPETMPRLLAFTFGDAIGTAPTLDDALDRLRRLFAASATGDLMWLWCWDHRSDCPRYHRQPL